MPMQIVELLQRVPATPRPEPLNDGRTIASLSAGLPDPIVDWALAIAHRAAEHIHQEIAPSRFEALAGGIGRSIEAISLNLMRYLLGGRETAAAVRISRAQRDATISSVHLGIPLTSTVGGLRRTGHVWKSAFIELTLRESPGPQAAELLSRVDRALSTYFDALVDDNSKNWAEEHRRLSDRRTLGQRQLVERVIAGRAVDDGMVAETIGVRANDEHVALILTADAQADGPMLDFAAFRVALERAFPTFTVTFLPSDSLTVWVFVSGQKVPLGRIVEAASQSLADLPGALVSIGLVASGTAGLRASHLTARAAHSLNLLTAKVGPVVSFAEHGLLCLVAQQPELARWFVEFEVGALRSTGAQRDELHETLRTLIGFNGSLVRTSEALFIHRNTIAYRLKKIEDALGRDPLARPAETGTALVLAELLGE